MPYMLYPKLLELGQLVIYIHVIYIHCEKMNECMKREKLNNATHPVEGEQRDNKKQKTEVCKEFNTADNLKKQNDNETVKIVTVNEKIADIIYKIRDEEEIIKKFKDLEIENDINIFKTWKSICKHGNTLLHICAIKGYAKVAEILIDNYKLDINEIRKSDKNTAYHMSFWDDKQDIQKLLEVKNADGNIENSYNETANCMKGKQMESRNNIVWLDLELTSLEHDGKIMEVAVYITDKDLNEKERKEWVIHHSEDALNTLSRWHLDNFADKDKGGNGLIKDCIASNISNDQCEAELLKIIKKHCHVKGTVPLAGSSIHCDQYVLKREMRSICEYLSHRIIDVSTIIGVMQRWTPNRLSGQPENKSNHRAMTDIEASIDILKWMRAEDGILKGDI
eukprot:GHVR01059722.1.p1 GENE.GHVR01059722.1~~GHVR01059722.1.p1  ORF type:complete len:394 (+),score=82.69 GHVR01059722.1:540-1721(+)